MAMAVCKLCASGQRSNSSSLRKFLLVKSSNVGKFGLSISRPRLTCMANYNVTLNTPEGTTVLDFPEDNNILDAADQAGLDLPNSCRARGCSSCAGVVTEGNVDQDEQTE